MAVDETTILTGTEERDKLLEGLGDILGMGCNLLLDSVVPNVDITSDLLELVLCMPMLLKVVFDLNRIDRVEEMWRHMRVC